MIRNDSRTVKKGDTFVCVPNPKEEEYIKDALARGATTIIGQKHLSHLAPDFIVTDNPRLYLVQELAKARNYKQPEYCVAVTGTNGKTSVVTYLRQIWKHLGVKGASLGSLGLDWDFCHHASREAGCGDPSWMATDPADLRHDDAFKLTTVDPIVFSQILEFLPADYFAFEASSHGLDQHRTDTCKLAAVCFTNLTNEHLDYHKTMEEYFQSKRRLFTELAGPETLKVIYKNCPYGRRLINENFPNTVTYGDEFPFPTDDLQIFGEAQLHNLTAAVLLSGFSLDRVKPILPLLTPPKGRMQYVGSNKKGGKIFVDFAHTPNALQNVLEMLRPITQGNLIVVFGCGGDRDKTKRPMMGKIASDLADMVIITEDNPRFENPDLIRKDIMEGASFAFEIHGRELAIAHAISIARSNDVVVIAGRGDEKYQKIQGKEYELHDETVIKKMLAVE
ncbi:MAG: UDP-N-acetylmuramoyl-L-alanyl-D-glutamate--2,6-diaminopimelate ligase [Alphaproteobacteria bacterium]|nr:MAG: UDP-N-acetylmuramoyl-L-alanyl-D-glutamate--2,6-diaminopimelate ligase [Alphaproteobacteria bacterium]